MAAVQLEHPYVRIVKGDVISYGGCQLWSVSETLRRCGCGPVAALDAAIYGSRAHGGGDRLLADLPREGPIPLELYDRLLQKLVRRYFPVVPPFGTNPTALTLGLNRLFRAEDIPLRAHVLPATKAPGLEQPPAGLPCPAGHRPELPQTVAEKPPALLYPASGWELRARLRSQGPFRDRDRYGGRVAADLLLGQAVLHPSAGIRPLCGRAQRQLDMRCDLYTKNLRLKWPEIFCSCRI